MKIHAHICLWYNVTDRPTDKIYFMLRIIENPCNIHRNYQNLHITYPKYYKVKRNIKTSKYFSIQDYKIKYRNIKINSFLRDYPVFCSWSTNNPPPLPLFLIFRFLSNSSPYGGPYPCGTLTKPLFQPCGASIS